MSYDVVLDRLSTRTREEFLAARMDGVTATQISIVLGLNPWVTPYQLYMEKIGEVEPDPGNEPMYWGLALEPAVAKRFEEDHPEWIVCEADLVARSKERPFMLASPDRFLRHPRGGNAGWGAGTITGPEPMALLELKTTANYESWDNALPDHYALQVIYQQDVLGLHETAHVAVFRGTREAPVYFQVEYDEAIAKDLRKAARAFYKQVKERIPPPVTGGDVQVLRKLHQDVTEGYKRELDPSVIELLRMREKCKAAIKGYYSEVDDIEAEIMAALGDAEIGTVAGEDVVTWKAVYRKGGEFQPSTSRRLVSKLPKEKA